MKFELFSWTMSGIFIILMWIHDALERPRAVKHCHYIEATKCKYIFSWRSDISIKVIRLMHSMSNHVWAKPMSILTMVL